MSQHSSRLVENALTKHYTKVTTQIVNSSNDLQALIHASPDLVFLWAKELQVNFGASERLRLSSMTKLLEDANILFTGSNSAALTLDVKKSLAKEVVTDAGLDTARFVVSYGYAKEYQANQLTFPLFAKPNRLGGSVGIESDSFVSNRSELHNKIGALAKYHKAESIIEEYLPGREFSVAILGRVDEAGLMSHPIEITASKDVNGNKILSHAVKSADSENTTSIEDEDLNACISNFAKQVFIAIGARDYGRIDIRLDKQGVPHFMEANLMPGLGSGYFARAFKLNNSLPYDEVVVRIAELAFARSEAKL